MRDDSSLSPDTDDLCFWVSELRAGRPDAAAPTFKKIVRTVERFARDRFKAFPRVGRFVDLDDVVQGSLVRLLAAFREVRPASRQHFYAVANELIRRELLDLVKHFYSPLGPGTHLSDVVVGEGKGEFAPVAPADAAARLDRLAAFHEAVGRLPPVEREVVGLIFYHDWTQAEIANLFRVSERTVRRWRDAAMGRLRGLLGDDNG